MIDPSFNDRRPPVSPQLAVRVTTLGVIAFALFAVIFFRLWYLQVLSGEQYVAEAQTNKVRVQPIAAPRGSIVDSKGRAIVRNRPAIVVAIKPESLPESERTVAAQYGDDRIKRAKKPEALRGPKVPIPPIPPELTERFARLGDTIGLRPTTIQDRVITGLFLAGYAPIKLKVAVPDDVQGYIAERQELFPGVTAESTFLRYYPHHDLAAQLLGTTSEISPEELKSPRHRGVKAGTVIGQSGIEAEYDKVLRGRDGKARLLVDAQGNPRGPGISQPPVRGNDVELTLNLDLQERAQAAYEELAGGKDGAFVALDPRNGAILAMGSFPTFDPNILQGTISQEKYDAIFNGSHGSPQFDRVISGRYATGSTFKPITALAALASHAISPTTFVDDPGCIMIDPLQRRCNAGNVPNGRVDMRNALRVSSDVYFYKLGLKTNRRDTVNPIQSTARKLGFERHTGIDLPGEETGLIPDPAWRIRVGNEEKACRKQHHVSLSASGDVAAAAGCGISDMRPWSEGDNVSLAIGQGDLQASPLQLAVAYSAFATGGQVPTPHLRKAVQDDQGTILQRFPPSPTRRVHMAPRYRDLIMAGLHDAASVPGGTSEPVFRGWNQSRFPVYGKTGTAENFGQGEDQSWYVAYAYDTSPRRRPIVVVATAEKAGFGAAVAAPIVCRIMRKWFGPQHNVGATCAPGDDRTR